MDQKKELEELETICSQIWLILNEVEKGNKTSKEAHNWICLRLEEFSKQAEQRGIDRCIDKLNSLPLDTFYKPHILIEKLENLKHKQ